MVEGDNSSLFLKKKGNLLCVAEIGLVIDLVLSRKNSTEDAHAGLNRTYSENVVIKFVLDLGHFDFSAFGVTHDFGV